MVKTIGCSSDPYIIAGHKLAARSFIDQRRGQLSFELDANDADRYTWTFSHISDIRLIGPELILGKIFDEIGFNKIPDKLFRHLVLSRIVHPVSKLKTTRYLREYNNEEYSVKQIYRYMDKLHEGQKEIIEQISYDHTLGILKNKLTIVFYDVTTVYFEAEKEDDLRIAGFSKDGRHGHPQILLGLLVSSGGYPLACSIFKGNTYEGHTLMTVVNHFKSRFSCVYNFVLCSE